MPRIPRFAYNYLFRSAVFHETLSRSSFLVSHMCVCACLDRVFHLQTSHICGKQKEALVTLSAPEKDATYTLIMSDPDAPTRENATLREFIHHGLWGHAPRIYPPWFVGTHALAVPRADPLRVCIPVVINVESRGTEPLILTDKGETALPYLGAAPPYNSGHHRYVWYESTAISAYQMGHTVRLIASARASSILVLYLFIPDFV